MTLELKQAYNDDKVAYRQARQQATQVQFQYAIVVCAVLLVVLAAIIIRHVHLDIAWWDNFEQAINFVAMVLLVDCVILFLDPFLDGLTGGAPFWRMVVNVSITIAIAPIHSFVESRLRRVSKNKSDYAAQH